MPHVFILLVGDTLRAAVSRTDAVWGAAVVLVEHSLTRQSRRVGSRTACVAR